MTGITAVSMRSSSSFTQFRTIFCSSSTHRSTRSNERNSILSKVFLVGRKISNPSLAAMSTDSKSTFIVNSSLSSAAEVGGDDDDDEKETTTKKKKKKKKKPDVDDDDDDEPKAREVEEEGIEVVLKKEEEMTVEELQNAMRKLKAKDVKDELKKLKMTQEGKKEELIMTLARARFDFYRGVNPIDRMREAEEEKMKVEQVKAMRRGARRLRTTATATATRTTMRRQQQQRQERKDDGSSSEDKDSFVVDGSENENENGDFTVEKSANVEYALKQTFQGGEVKISERKGRYARDHLLTSFVNVSTSSEMVKKKNKNRMMSGGDTNNNGNNDNDQEDDDRKNALWYTIECTEAREKQAMANCLNIPGVIDVWCPRKPPPGFFLSKEDCKGRTDLEIRQLIVEGEPIQAGFILAKVVDITGEIIKSLESEYFIQKIAHGGKTSFGKRDAAKREIAEPVDPNFFEGLLRASKPVIVTSEEYEARLKEVIGDVMTMSKDNEEDKIITNVSSTAGAKKVVVKNKQRNDLSVDDNEMMMKEERPKKTYDLEIFNGPFKGFHGNVVDRLEDGAIRAQIIIFGKLNVVTLEASEYKEMKNE